MIKPRHLFTHSILWLVWTLAFTSSTAPDDPTRNLTTVAARRAALNELLARRPEVQAAGDVVALVQLDNEIVQLYLKFWDTDSAAQEVQNSLQLAEQFAGSPHESVLVDTLTLSGRVHIRRNEISPAVDNLERALQLSRALQYRDGEAQALSQRAYAYLESDERDKAEELDNQALAIWRDLPNKPAEALALIRQGEIYMVDERADEATAALRQAETICRSLDDRPCIATALIDLGYQAIRQGQWQTALSFFNEVDGLNIETEAEPHTAGEMSMGFGLVYEAYSQLEPARSYLEDALRYYKDGAHDKRATADARSKLARICAALRDFVSAHYHAQEALAAAIETGNNLSIGLAHEDLGRVWLESGDYDSARPEFLSAIEYFTKSKSPRPLARAQIYLGNTEQALGNTNGAVAAYTNALGHFQTNLDYTNEAVARFGLGKLELQSGQLDKAETNLRRSIELTERLREYASSKDLRSSFLGSVHDRYQTYVELLMTRSSKERDHELAIRAFEVNESGRARALVDSLHVLRELRQPSNPALLPQEERLLNREQELIDKRSKLISEGSTEADEASVARDVIDVQSKIEALKARINADSRFDYLLPSGPLRYDDIRNELTNSETSLLSYSLGTRRSFAWLITKDGVQSFDLPDKATIEKAATPLVTLLKTAPDDPSEQGRLQSMIGEVSDLVIKPIASKLATSRLIVIADGVLQYVPFQILKTSAAASDPLIATVDIVNEPSASALVLVRRQVRNKANSSRLLVGFGDAIFSPEDVGGGAGNANSASNPTANSSTQTRGNQASQFSKLPPIFNARHELMAISEMTGDDSAFFIAHDATRENLLRLDLTQFRILHVLTHGVLNAQRPELSGLVLSLIDANNQQIPGFVSLADIYRLHAPELVVLSACDTALGDNQSGEGLIGVTRGFMYAGASGVVASLWEVDDDSTTELMKYFYADMLQGGMGPAAALRDAQNKIRSQPKWRSPYYWAGFTFQGNYDLRIQAVRPSSVHTYRRLIAGGPVVILLLTIVYWYLRRRPRVKSTTQQ